MVLISALLLPFVQSADAEPVFDCPRLNGSNSTIALSQGKNGWVFRSEDLRLDFIPSDEALGYFAKFNDVLAKLGTKFIYLTLPPRALLAEDNLDYSNPMQKYYDPEVAHESYNNFISKMRAAGIKVVDLLDVDDAIDDSFPLSFARDHHWRDEGSVISAKQVAEIMLENAGDDFGGEKYETVKLSTQQMLGPIAEEMQRLCDSDIPGENFNIYKTSLKVDDKGADALFGGDERQPIAVVGSSYSGNPKFNFEGFLAEYAGHPVANYAIPGGEIFNSIISMVSDTKFKDQKPPFLIWEAQAVYDISTTAENNFRQIIPAIYGDCEGEEIAKNSVSIKNGVAQTLLNLDESQEIFGEDYYLMIESDNLGFAKFTLEVEYEDGDGEWFSVDRTYRFINRGRFFVGLSDEINAPVVKIKIAGMPEINANLDVAVCKASASENES